jgi:hypothetical protein
MALPDKIKYGAIYAATILAIFYTLGFIIFMQVFKMGQIFYALN